MATQQAKPGEGQKQQSQEQREQRSEMARNTPQGGGLARRGGSGQLSLFSLTPFELFRMNPFSLMRRMTEEMDRAFGDVAGDVTPAAWSPAIEITERDNNYVVRAELPGLKPEEVQVEITGDALVIQGEHEESREEEDRGKVHRSEIRYGQFYRRIPLPEEANADQAQARFENGVLQVTIPVPRQQSQRRQIPVQTTGSGSPAKEAA